MSAPVDELKAQQDDGESKYVIQDNNDTTGEATTYTVGAGVEPDDPDDPEGEMFEHAEYEIEVGRTTATDDVTGEQYTLWRAQGRPVGTTADGFREVSPNLPEAIMAVCEALERGDV